MPKSLTILLCACLLALGGCNLIYKQNIQQGNALEQEDLDQLELGMSKNQVAYLLGTPAIHDPFHHDRWDYISTFSRRGGDAVRRLVTLRFENDQLAAMTGVKPEDGETLLTDQGTEAIKPEVALPGVAVEDARAYEDVAMVSHLRETWTVQVGSFSTRDEAESRKQNLETQGFEVEIFTQVIGDTGFFVVRTGDFADREAAVARLSEIEERTRLRPFLVSPGH